MNSFKLFVASKFVRLLPETRAFAFKRVIYRWAGAKIGENVRICSSVKIYGIGDLEIGENTWIGHETLIIASSNIVVGKNCDIAPSVFIGTGTHIIDVNSPNVAGDGVSYPIRIGDGCWICANVTILPGTSIGNKSIIAAGSIAKGSIPGLEVWGGILAKKIREIK